MNYKNINTWKFIEFSIFVIVFIYACVIVIFNFFNKLPFKFVKLQNKTAVDNINHLITDTFNTDKNTKHIWNEDITDDIQQNISEINSEMLNILNGDFQYVPSMTELYYSSKGNQNSDKQYVSNHLDGPFYACGLYRAIVAINGNKNIDTYFPDDNIKVNLKKYEVAIFDYNNELHYIDVNNNEVDNSQRILLKLHYVKKNESNICENIHCKFGRETRDLFELNKTQLYSSGVIAKSSLHYTTYRKYTLIFIFLLLIYYYYSSNVIAKYILYLFTFIEISGIGYIIHFLFPLYDKVCGKHD